MPVAAKDCKSQSIFCSFQPSILGSVSSSIVIETKPEATSTTPVLNQPKTLLSVGGKKTTTTTRSYGNFFFFLRCRISFKCAGRSSVLYSIALLATSSSSSGCRQLKHLVADGATEPNDLLLSVWQSCVRRPYIMMIAQQQGTPSTPERGN